jgi:hypothetical protein
MSKLPFEMENPSRELALSIVKSIINLSQSEKHLKFLSQVTTLHECTFIITRHLEHTMLPKNQIPSLLLEITTKKLENANLGPYLQISNQN